jgi:hypothetical protein
VNNAAHEGRFTTRKGQFYESTQRNVIVEGVVAALGVGANQKGGLMGSAQEEGAAVQAVLSAWRKEKVECASSMLSPALANHKPIQREE